MTTNMHLIVFIPGGLPFLMQIKTLMFLPLCSRQLTDTHRKSEGENIVKSQTLIACKTVFYEWIISLSHAIITSMSSLTLPSTENNFFFFYKLL